MLRFLAAAALATIAVAQAPSPWSTLAVPSGVVAARCQSLGKLVTYRDGATLHAWSAVTRAWSSHPVSAQAGLRLHNDCLLALDGGAWVAYSAFTGRFATLPVGPAAALLNASGAQNDMLLAVADQGQLHVFAATDGQWRARPVAANFQVVAQRNVLLLQEGSLLSAMDAATATWHDRVVAAVPTQLSADGGAAFAWGAGTVHAFSAPHASWRDAHEPNAAAFVRGDDWAAFCGADRALAFSAIRGEFAGLSAGGLQLVSLQDLFGLFDDGAAIRAFAAVSGSWSAPLAPTGASVAARSGTALLSDGSGTHGYSAVRNAASLLPGALASSGVADLVAWARPAAGSAPWFFSGLTGAWIEGPQGLTTDPLLTTTAAAAPTAAGVVAFSPRTGRFVPLAEPGAQLAGNPSSAPLVAIGAVQAHAFDARVGRWVSRPRAATGPVTPQIWRTTALLLDGGTALTFAAQTGEWSAQPLPGPLTGLRANSESLRLATSNDVYAWSALAGAGWFAQFPEFRRVQAADAPVTWFAAAPPGGGLVVPAIGLPAIVPVAVPGLGALLVAPDDAVLLPPVALAADATHVAQLPMPSGWPLLAPEFALQAACLPAAGSPYLTGLATLRPQ